MLFHGRFIFGENSRKSVRPVPNKHRLCLKLYFNFKIRLDLKLEKGRSYVEH